MEPTCEGLYTTSLAPRLQTPVPSSRGHLYFPLTGPYFLLGFHNSLERLMELGKHFASIYWYLVKEMIPE